MKRYDIVSLIKKNEKTKDNIFWFPLYQKIICNDNEDYYYDIDYFKHNSFFSENDLKAFVSKKKIDNYDPELMEYVSKKFKVLFYFLFGENLNYSFGLYTLSDLIDNFVFFNYLKQYE